MKSKISLLFVIVLLLSSCGVSQKAESSQQFPLKPNVKNSLLAKWAQKEVLDSKLIDDMEGDSLWFVGLGPSSITYTNERSVDGERSLRYHSSMLDSAYIQSQRTPWGSFGGIQGGESYLQLEFDGPQDWTAYNRLSVWVYIHPSKNPNVHFSIDIEVEDNIIETLTPGREMNVDIPQGQWCNVLWDIDYLRRDKVRRLMIFQTSIGYDRDMGEQYITIDFDRFELQKVEPDNYSGWDINDGEFAFSHIGYRPYDNKVALTKANKESVFTLENERGKTVYTGKSTIVANKGNLFASLDFTDFNSPGTYIIKYGDSRSRSFKIGDDVWLHPMFSAINFYYCQRCGYEVPGVHSICHQDMQGFYEDEKKVINGGWHDAGDLSQGFWRTADGCIALMRCLDVVDGNEDLTAKLAEEAKWGVEWLLKTRFHDGRHISWVLQRIYSDNKIGTYDDVVTPAVNEPWENFQGTVVFLMAAKRLKSLAERKDELIAAAVDNWQHAMDDCVNKKYVQYLESAWGATSSAMLYEYFGDEKYKDAALKFGNLLVDSQEQEFKEGIPITGYFYLDNSKKDLIHNSHASFDETTMIALRKLCSVFPDEADWMKWYSAAAIFNEYYIKRGSNIASPYNLVPNGVFRRADAKKYATDDGKPNYYLVQYEAGTQLNNNYALRTFPIWYNYTFHGGTNCHLATSWAMAEASLLLNDKAGVDLVQQQMEWIFGRNPFGQSLMYGVGYDFSPMFVYCTHNIVGALPVGVDCYDNDEPYWHGANYATYKEIWVEPVSRFLGTLATYLSVSKKKSDVEVVMKADGDDVTATLKGKGKHHVKLLLYNTTTDFVAQDVDLSSVSELKFHLAAEDISKPYVAALIVDGDTEHAAMLSGAKY